MPVAQWKDSLWDLGRYGYLHCSVLNACCCTGIAVGQLMTRMQLNHWGRPDSVAVVSTVFRKLLLTVMAFWFSRLLLFFVIFLFDPNIDSVEWVEPPAAYHIFCTIDDLLAWVYLGYLVYALKNLRSHVRSKYAIPEARQCPSGCEDGCCSLCCPCFVAAQMMRHTADYDTYGGRCCTSTGLPSHAPNIV